MVAAGTDIRQKNIEKVRKACLANPDATPPFSSRYTQARMDNTAEVPVHINTSLCEQEHLKRHIISGF